MVLWSSASSLSTATWDTKQIAWTQIRILHIKERTLNECNGGMFNAGLETSRQAAQMCGSSLLKLQEPEGPMLSRLAQKRFGVSTPAMCSYEDIWWNSIRWCCTTVISSPYYSLGIWKSCRIVAAGSSSGPRNHSTFALDIWWSATWLCWEKNNLAFQFINTEASLRGFRALETGQILIRCWTHKSTWQVTREHITSGLARTK